MLEAVALSWAPTGAHGWGVFAANLLKELLRRGTPRPLVLAPIPLELIAEEEREPFQALAEAQREFAKRTAQEPTPLTLPRTCVLHSLGNALRPDALALRYRGQPNVAFAFFERTDFPADVVARSAWLDRLLVGSRWNAEHLRARGFPDVACVLQGVDTEAFRPGPAKRPFGDRFVIFSGGKLELRKGQDLVVAAFRRFRERHPDALLATVWMNWWPAIMADIASSPHVTGCPSTGADGRAIHAWVCAQGIPDDAHLDFGWVPNSRMPEVLRGCDAALFASRCEGGTNLVAMEAMASGLPCVLSANTGHLDLLDDARAYPLRQQSPTRFGPPGSAHWRDSDLDEIVETLEAIYTRREEAAQRGRAAHAFMQGLDWSVQVAKLLAALDAPRQG